MSRVLEAARSVPWLMLPESVEDLLAIAARLNEVSAEALEAYRAQSMAQGERVTQRGTTAIIPVTGPLIRRANMFSAISGATSYDMVRRDLQTALDDQSIRSIILNIDSPGGEANGTAELAAAIFEGRKAKRIVAYVGGTGASAAYWLAAAATEIVISPTAILGSVGVAMAITERDPQSGVRQHEFISSVSPHKRSNPNTDDGRARIQATVDRLADVFVASVATYRGIEAADLPARFGQGGLKVGADAVDAGMADRIGFFEEVVANLAERGGTGGLSQSHNQQRIGTMSDDTPVAAPQPVAPQPAAAAPQVDVDRITADARTEGASAERQRITAVLSADGISANGARMAAALQFMAIAPGASAADVVAYVTANVAAGKPMGTREAGLAARSTVPDSLAAAGIGTPDPKSDRASETHAIADNVVASLNTRFARR
ncbi:protease [Stappia sp. 22II-S9-Z10]|nr:protease [Stappia sp. 22II-S9-Z10]